MAHKKAVKALIRTPQDLRDNRDLIKGIVVLLGDDFRQMLPVIS